VVRFAPTPESPWSPKESPGLERPEDESNRANQRDAGAPQARVPQLRWEYDVTSPRADTASTLAWSVAC
jgi:hypothetical protein